MKAALLQAYNSPLIIEDVKDPETPKNGVTLSVLACGVCRSDWHAWTGADPDVKAPFILGHEFCGVVEEVGSDCHNWKVGDRVIAPFVLGCGTCPACSSGEATTCSTQEVPGFTIPGAFAEMIAVPRADFNLAHLPDGLDPSAAAGLGCRVTTAFRALVDRGCIRPGEWLAVHGCGGVGLSAIMLGRALGAQIVAVDIMPEKLELALQLGAHYTVNAAENDAAEAICEITKGGAHVSVEALGISATFEASVKSLRPLGRHVQIGMPTGKDERPELPLNVVYSRQLSLHGTRGMPAHRFPDLFSLLEASNIDPLAMVTQQIALDQASNALAALNDYTGAGIAVINQFK